jgi:trigger factor
LNYIAEIPELTDELAKKLSGGEYDNVKDYVESVRSSIQSGYDEDYKNSVFTMIMGKLSELYPVEQYPEANIEYNINDIMDRYIKPYASMYGMSLDDFIASAYNGLTEEEFRETQLAPAAQANLAQEIILTAIAEKEGITMTDQELDKLLASYAEEYGVTVEELTAGMDRESIRSSELQQAVMNWLYENVTIEEVEETEPAELSGFETEAETEISAAQTEAETAAMTETE